MFVAQITFFKKLAVHFITSLALRVYGLTTATYHIKNKTLFPKYELVNHFIDKIVSYITS